MLDTPLPTILDTLTRGFIFGAIGICIEVLFTGLNARMRFGNTHYEGCSYGWMLPAYAIGGLVFDTIRRLVGPHEEMWLIPLYVLLIYVFEAVYGAFLRALLGSIPWEYKSGWHFKGLIRFDYLPLWIVVACFFNPIARHVG